MQPLKIALAARVALLVALTITASPGPAVPASRYQPKKLSGGYTDRIVEPGLWRVDAVANGRAEPGFAQNMAAYRAADILREAGFEYMQIVDQKGEYWSMGGMPAGGKSTLWVRGAHNPGAPVDCRAKQPETCVTIPVARTMERTRPLLRFPD